MTLMYHSDTYEETVNFWNIDGIINGSIITGFITFTLNILTISESWFIRVILEFSFIAIISLFTSMFVFQRDRYEGLRSLKMLGIREVDLKAD